MIGSLNILVAGNTLTAKVLVVADPPPVRAWEKSDVMSPAASKVFSMVAMGCGFKQNDFCFIAPCPPMRDEGATDSKANKFLEQYREEFLTVFNSIAPEVGLIVYLGKWAGRQVMGRSIKIMDVRGQIHEYEGLPAPVLPLMSPSTVLRRPENAEIFETDFKLAGALRDSDWDLSHYISTRLQGRYRWCMDLTKEFDLDNPPKGVCADVETVGLAWHDNQRVLCVQLSWKKDESVLVPLDIEYWNNEDRRGTSSSHLPKLTKSTRKGLIKQLGMVFGNPAVAFVGHNFKFDLHALRGLGIEVANWLHDTMQLAFVVDDNMLRKSLDECTRRWLQALAGYADEFNAKTDKSRMDLVSHDDMCLYGGGDTDATRQLCFTLVKLAQEDKGNYRCYTKIQMPALRTFFDTERAGIRRDQDALLKLGDVAKEYEDELRSSLLSRVSGKVKRRHLDDEKHKGKTPAQILSFTRDDFKRDILFLPKGKGGMGFVPRVFTKGTRRLSPEERIPSTSSKEHLPYFDHDPFVRDLIDYVKLQKLRTTYIGLPEHAQFSSVGLLKSGKKYQKKVQDTLDEYDCTYEFLPAVDGEPEELQEILEVSSTQAIVIDALHRPWWRDTIEPTGFWQHLSKESCIYPSFALHKTVTGRSSSENPNGQNIPKRGTTPKHKEFVAAYRRCFVAKPGCVLIEADLSQAELRLIAWMAQDPTMLEVYRTGGDIHTTTACRVMGISLEEFHNLSEDDQGMARFKAKAVNFGFMYGMWWVSFRSYAKVEYGIDLTEEEAEKMYKDFFSLYSSLHGWHDGMKTFASKHGFVRSMHGALRRLPSVWSIDDQVQKYAQRQGINCLSDDTEMLTARGWVGVDGLSIGEQVFSVDPGSGELSLDSLQDITQGYLDQEMLHYDGTISAVATPEHRWLIDRYNHSKKVKGDIVTEFKTSSQLSDYGDHKIWLCGKPWKAHRCGKHSPRPWTDKGVVLLGWVLTDGHYKKERPKCVGVTQSKSKNFSELEKLFNSLGKHSYRVRSRGQRIWEITCLESQRIRESLPDKTLTPEVVLALTPSQRILLYEAMLKGDGCWDSQVNRYRRFVAGTKDRAEAFLMLCSLIGKPARAFERDYSHYTPKKYPSMGNIPKSGVCWLVELKQCSRAQSGYAKHWDRWKGRVWCPTTKHGTWIAKRNGTVFVTGNSPIQRMASDLGLMGMSRFTAKCPMDKMWPIGFIHDSVVLEAKVAHADEACGAIKHYLQTPPLQEVFGIQSPIPIVSDVSVGINLYDMHEQKGLEAVVPAWA